MTTEQALSICEQVLARCGGDADVTVSQRDEALLRFANNQPIAHTTSQQAEVSLGLRLGQRYGQATSQSTSPEALDKMIAEARAQAELLPEEPDLLPSVGPQTLPEVAAYVPAGDLAGFGAEARAAAMEAMVAPSRRAGMVAAGICSNGVYRVAMATTNGMRGAYEATSLDYDLTAMADDSSGRASAWTRDPRSVDAAALGDEAVDKARRSAGPVALEPGAYRVVLSADAVSQLLYYLGGGFNARAVKEGRTWVATRRGQQVTAPCLSLAMDVTHPLLAARPFDGDGGAVRRVTMIRDGIAADLLYDRRTAAEDGVEATGWSGGGRNAGGAGPAALVLSGGSASDDDLLAACDDGVYVERLWYTNWVDPQACLVTGMTRDGLYRIRGGKLAEPLLNLRFNQGLLSLFGNILALSKPTARENIVAPALAAGEFTLSSGTSF